MNHPSRLTQATLIKLSGLQEPKQTTLARMGKLERSGLLGKQEFGRGGRGMKEGNGGGVGRVWKLPRCIIYV